MIKKERRNKIYAKVKTTVNFKVKSNKKAFKKVSTKMQAE